MNTMKVHYFGLFFLAVFIFLPLSLFSVDLAGTSCSHKIYTLWFEKDKTLLIGVNGDMPIGTYVQNGNTVTLNYSNNPYKDDLVLDKKLTIQETPNSVLGNYKLVGQSGTEWTLNSLRPKEGEKRAVGSIIAYIHRTDGSLKENTRIRLGPGTQYDYISFKDNSGNSLTAVQKAEYIVIYARSENKTTIDGISEYWYYCRYRVSINSEIFGWIWGGLIDFENANPY